MTAPTPDTRTHRDLALEWAALNGSDFSDKRIESIQASLTPETLRLLIHAKRQREEMR